MIFVMASEGAISTGRARAHVIQPAIGRSLHIIQVEVDQMLVRADAVGIMAGGASGFLVNDVFAVTFETLV